MPVCHLVSSSVSTYSSMVVVGFIVLVFCRTTLYAGVGKSRFSATHMENNIVIYIINGMWP